MPPNASRDDLWTESLSDHKTRQATQIVMTALEIVTADGMSGLTMSSIADRAGISRQTLYRYYADIEAVLTAAVKSTAGMDAHIKELIGEGPAGARLDAFVAVVLESASAGHPSPTQLEQSLPPQARDAAREHADQVERLVVEIIEEGVDDGSFSADLDPAIDGALVYRFLISAHDLVVDVGEPAIIEHITDSVHRLVDPSRS